MFIFILYQIFLKVPLLLMIKKRNSVITNYHTEVRSFFLIFSYSKIYSILNIWFNDRSKLRATCHNPDNVVKDIIVVSIVGSSIRQFATDVRIHNSNL